MCGVFKIIRELRLIQLNSTTRIMTSPIAILDSAFAYAIHTFPQTSVAQLTSAYRIHQALRSGC